MKNKINIYVALILLNILLFIIAVSPLGQLCSITAIISFTIVLIMEKREKK
jgi:uncharacterized membrane-anchored protein YitT (DUF2179 family)